MSDRVSRSHAALESLEYERRALARRDAAARGVSTKAAVEAQVRDIARRRALSETHEAPLCSCGDCVVCEFTRARRRRRA